MDRAKLNTLRGRGPGSSSSDQESLLRNFVVDINKLAKETSLYEKKQVGAFEAKTQFSAILQQVEKGRSFIITRRGKPVAEIRPVEQKEHRPRFGWAQGRVRLAPDFDEPLPEMEEYTG